MNSAANGLNLPQAVMNLVDVSLTYERAEDLKKIVSSQLRVFPEITAEWEGAFLLRKKLLCFP